MLRLIKHQFSFESILFLNSSISSSLISGKTFALKPQDWQIKSKGAPNLTLAGLSNSSFISIEPHLGQILMYFAIKPDNIFELLKFPIILIFSNHSHEFPEHH